MFKEEIEVLRVDTHKLHELQRKIGTCYTLPDWIKLLSMYKLNENWGKVTKTINTMSDRFNLREGFWLKETEVKGQRLNPNSKEDVKQLMSLFEKGLENGDYAQLADKYSSFLLHMYQQNHILMSVAESKLEDLIGMFKDDPKTGSLFFHRLRKLYRIKPTPEEILKTRKAYHRQLSLPFDSIDVVFDEYKNWESDEEEFHKISSIYEQMKDKLDKLLDDIKNRRLESLPPRIAINLLERDSQLDEEAFIEHLSKLPIQKQFNVLRRQSKDGKFIDRYLQSLHKLHPNDEQLINQEYYRVLSNCGNRLRYYYQRVFLETIIRRLNKHLLQNQTQEYLDEWPSKFVYFRQQIAKFVDENEEVNKKNELYTLWADVEAYVAKDLPSTNEISNRLLANSKEDQTFYLQYAHRLVSLGAVADALQLLKRGLSACSNRLPIAKEYARLHILFGIDRFEESVGSKQSTDNRFIKQTKDSRARQTSPAPTPRKTKKDGAEEGLKGSSGDYHAREQAPNKKRPREPEAEQELINQKIENQQKRRHHNDSGNTVFVKGLTSGCDEQMIMKLFKHPDNIKDIRIVRDRDGNCKGFCYVDFQEADQATAECRTFNEEPLQGIQMNLSRPPKQYDEKCTIFLCALPATADEEKVRELLKDYTEQVHDVRLIRTEESTKGYCYVQLKTEAAKKAVLQDFLHRKLLIDGKRILVEECDSNRQKTKKQLQVVFLEGLSYKATPLDIKDFFKVYNIKDIATIELPKTDDGRSKGIAYIEFQHFVDFQRAIDMKVGNIRGREFKILRSDRAITHKKDRSHTASQPAQELSNSDFSKLFSK